MRGGMEEAPKRLLSERGGRGLRSMYNIVKSPFRLASPAHRQEQGTGIDLVIIDLTISRPIFFLACSYVRRG